MFSFMKYFKKKKDPCAHEFNGTYNIRASNMTVEMNCVKCGALGSWTFDEWDEITKGNNNE